MNPLNLEAGCARCVLDVLGVHSVLGVLGLVVAGRFWCSYAWVSLTPTTRVRPRAPVIERVCARVRV